MNAMGLETAEGVALLQAQLTELDADIAADSALLSSFQTSFDAALNAAQTTDVENFNNSYNEELSYLTDTFTSAINTMKGELSTLQSELNYHLGLAFGDAHSQFHPLCVLDSVYSSSDGAVVGYQVIIIPTVDGTTKRCLYVPASLSPNTAINPADSSSAQTTSNLDTPCPCVIYDAAPPTYTPVYYTQAPTQYGSVTSNGIAVAITNIGTTSQGNFSTFYFTPNGNESFSMIQDQTVVLSGAQGGSPQTYSGNFIVESVSLTNGTFTLWAASSS